MPQIEYGHSYSLEDLVDIWHSGWRKLAMFAAELGFEQDLTEWMSCRQRTLWALIAQAGDEIFDRLSDVHIPFGAMRSLCVLTLLGNKKYSKRAFFDLYWKHWHEVIKQESPSILEAIRDTTKALASSRTIGDAVVSLVGKANWEMCGPDTMLSGLVRVSEAEIEERWAEAFSWLHRAVIRTVSEEESWWNCAWLVIEEHLSYLREIEERIVEDVPLTEDQHFDLNDYIQYGRPVGYWSRRPDGAETYDVYLEVAHEEINRWDLERAAAALLVQPAFRIAQGLRNRCSKPRFLRRCRAPSCGKEFWTGRANATNCPGSQSNKKNPCALEWIRYKRYLSKLGNDPETAWNTADLQEKFRTYDQS